MEKIKIGFFDSGIGGVTVLNECMKNNPNFEYIYYSDSKNNPYGDKEENEIITYASEITKELIKRECKIIVIACNTASLITAEFLREKFKDINFVAIEPAMKPAFENGKGTLVIATKGTMESKRFKENYAKYHRENFYMEECVGLADLIENDNKEKIEEYVEEKFGKFKGKVENVVLGCTHYPLIKNEISNVLGKVTFFDGACGLAKQLDKIIKESNFCGGQRKIIFIDSSNDRQKEKRFWTMIEN